MCVCVCVCVRLCVCGIYIASLKGNYSEVLPTQACTKERLKKSTERARKVA